MSPRVKPKPRVDFADSTRAGQLRLEADIVEERRRIKHGEFRSAAVRGERLHAASPADVFWKYLLSREVQSPMGGPMLDLDREEHRVLSKASNAAGGYLVPTSFDDQISAARRARAVIGAVSRELLTGDGSQLLVPTTTRTVSPPGRRKTPATPPPTRCSGR